MPYCKSCEKEQPVEFSYCPNCGAKAVERRLTMKAITREFFHILTNFEGPIWQTVKDLTIQPFKVSDGYISGVRMKYLSPMRYLIIAFTISGFLFVLFQDEFGAFYEESMSTASFERGYETANPNGEAPDPAPFAERIQGLIQKYTNLFGYLYIPFLAIFAKWWLNKKNQYNLAESLVAATYIGSHSTILVLPVYLLGFIPGLGFTLVATLTSLLSLLVYLWMALKIYRVSVLRSLMALIVSFLVYYLVVIILTTAYVLLTI